MNREQLVQWIQNPDVIPSRRRLYLTMLGVCGNKEQLPLLEQIIRSDDRDMKTALDAVVACYLTLAGPDGLPLIEERFLKNPDAEYTDTYAAIMALRFHGQEEQVIPTARLVKSLEYMLDRPQLADLVIPDLARWEDWDVTDRLVTLFKEANEDTSWVRVPVINFLKASPRPDAPQLIEELAKIDPDAVKRASTAFPFAGAVPVPTPTSNPDATSTQEESAQVDAAALSVEELPEVVDSAPSQIAATPAEPKVAQASNREEPAAIAKESLVEPPTFSDTPIWLVLIVPIAIGVLLLGIYVVVLRGHGREAKT
jgi:hypothetical protein